MARTVEQLKDSILEYGFARTQYTGAINRWLDEGQRYIFRRAKLRNKEEKVIFNTEAGVATYSIMPSNFAQVTYVLNKSTNPECNLDSVHDLKKFNELALVFAQVNRCKFGVHSFLKASFLMFPLLGSS